MKTLLSTLLVLGINSPVFAARAPIKTVSADPYASALVIDADTGDVLFEQNSDAVLFPASMVKLMTMLIITERIDAGELTLNDYVHVTAEAARMGGAQVYLAEGESFTLDEMMYALAIKSANDVAVALAVHLAGSKDGFVQVMNERAAQLGLTSTRFASVHGLPPDEGQEPDRSTARDMARLSQEILKHPSILQYTSAKEKWFRDNKFQMLTHNRLLRNVDGCDGLKTGYFTAAGFSISASAKRNGRRVIAVVMGSKVRQTRDSETAALIDKGFSLLRELPPPPPPAPAPVAAPATPAAPVAPTQEQPETSTGSIANTDAPDAKTAEDKKPFPWLIVVLTPLAIVGLFSIARQLKVI